MHFRQWKRREALTLLGGTAAWPLTARAQQPAVPTIGFLSSLSPDGFTERLRAFRQGLKETGHVEGETVAIEYRWAQNQGDRLPALAADLVSRRAAVIMAPQTSSALAAKAATTSIPIVFLVGGDPVALGLAASLNRPGGNATGVNILLNELVEKRLELLREMVPGATRMAVLVNPANVALAEATRKGVEAAARTLALQIKVVNASTPTTFMQLSQTLLASALTHFLSPPIHSSPTAGGSSLLRSRCDTASLPRSRRATRSRWAA
jgi:putative ABC transport system substrate-binding protein